MSIATAVQLNALSRNGIGRHENRVRTNAGRTRRHPDTERHGSAPTVVDMESNKDLK